MLRHLMAGMNPRRSECAGGGSIQLLSHGACLFQQLSPHLLQRRWVLSDLLRLSPYLEVNIIW